jgi:hypothetical protein
MMVRTECKGRRVTGIYIGTRNARRNFSRQDAAIEFELGHLRIGCELGPGFWRDQPRICDPRLCEWLEFKLYRERRYLTPLPLALVQSGRNAYRLRPVVLPSVSLAGIGDFKAAVPHRQDDGQHNGQLHHGLTAIAGRKPHHLTAHPAAVI